MGNLPLHVIWNRPAKAAFSRRQDDAGGDDVDRSFAAAPAPSSRDELKNAPEVKYSQ